MTATTNAVPQTMTAVTARRYGSSKVLKIETVPTPALESGKLLVRVRASSANALDWHMMSGTPYFLKLFAGLLRPKRVIHGADIAGTVEAVGEGVSGFDVGDAVFCNSNGGGFGEYAAVRATAVMTLPKGVDLIAAGATPVAGLTALQALRTHGAVTKDDRVLINGAAGGVGTFAIQIAKALGARDITAVCSTKNVEQSRTLGASRVIDYAHEDFAAAGDKYDLIIDMMGNRTTAQFRSILAPGARYVGVSGPMANRLLGPVFYQARMKRALRRTDASFHGFTAAATREDLAFLADLLATGKLVPTIERVVGFDGVARALDQIASGHGSGKIVIVPNALDSPRG